MRGARFPATNQYHGTKLFLVENGKRLATPLFFVIVALGTTDLLFALDSIPAIYGLTPEPYIVLAANLFALMGLRQLYFLLGGLLQQLVYLSIGLAVLLAFIGVKLLLHALHENERRSSTAARTCRPRDPDLDVPRGHRPHPRHHDGPQPAQDPQGRARGRSSGSGPDGVGAPSGAVPASGVRGLRRVRLPAGAQPQHEGGCRDDQCHAEQLGRGQHLTEHDEPRERRERRAPG